MLLGAVKCLFNVMLHGNTHTIKVLVIIFLTALKCWQTANPKANSVRPDR